MSSKSDDGWVFWMVLFLFAKACGDTEPSKAEKRHEELMQRCRGAK